MQLRRREAQVRGHQALVLHAVVGVGVANDQALQGRRAGLPGVQIGQQAQLSLGHGALVELRWWSGDPRGIVEPAQPEHVLVQRHVLAPADDGVNAPGLELANPGAVNEAAVHQQAAEGAGTERRRGGGHQPFALGQISVLAPAAGGESPTAAGRAARRRAGPARRS